MTNVLITSIGRQNDLVEAFKSALQAGGTVLAADADETAPGLNAADEGFVSPPWQSDEYIEWLFEVCRRHRVRLLLSLHESDLSVLEVHRKQLEDEGIAMLGTPHLPVDVVTDKFDMAKRLASYGVMSPTTYKAEDVASGEVEMEGPLVVKPRRGRGSQGLEQLSSTDELSGVLQCHSETSLIVQPQVQGQEYGMDVINDFNGRFRAALVRRKLRMRNGETDRAVTVCEESLVRVAEKVSQCTQHSGVFDVDLMIGANGPMVIDINPRFGGGYMFNHAAGANAPAALVNWLNTPDEHADFLSYEEGVVSQRLSPVRQVEAPKFTTEA